MPWYQAIGAFHDPAHDAESGAVWFAAAGDVRPDSPVSLSGGQSAAAIFALDNPRATSVRTSRSRPVSTLSRPAADGVTGTLLPLLEKIPLVRGRRGRPRRRPDTLFADRAHDHEKYHQAVRRRPGRDWRGLADLARRPRTPRPALWIGAGIAGPRRMRLRRHLPTRPQLRPHPRRLRRHPSSLGRWPGASSSTSSGPTGGTSSEPASA